MWRQHNDLDGRSLGAAFSGQAGSPDAKAQF
jgi:hypothetical protein